MKQKKPITIAIDGPAASGKSTTARLVAQRLGYLYIDSGAMYRAVTLAALQSGIAVEREDKIAELAAGLRIEFGKNTKHTQIFLNGEDVSEAIRTPEIDSRISPVAANPRVRRLLVRWQQELGRAGGVVMDGRDIGTVVFPNAELKIFLVATVEERARRRQKELLSKGEQVDLAKIEADIRYRDEQDRSRVHGPLRKAKDAVEVDTTRLSIEEQVDVIVKLAGRHP